MGAMFVETNLNEASKWKEFENVQSEKEIRKSSAVV